MEVQALSQVMLARAEKAPDTVAYESIDSRGVVTTLTYAQPASRATDRPVNSPSTAKDLRCQPDWNTP
ncbi:hypothetical protein ABZS68_36145 [Streptomyces sp. NPDC005571]|uniref:hypothetical protein n=1 Tax=Streptomyces sp. NPDC005571 TaxID=3156888 RepID=UPI0033AEAAD2